MIDFFDRIRFWGGKRNLLLERIYFYRFMNRGSQILANLALPVWFLLTRNKYHLKTHRKTGEKIIVSLTSFPARISKVWLVVEAILRQTYPPDKIVLYLTKSQIPDLTKLPDRLLEQLKRGLEIRFCEEEIRSHTKYYGAFRDFPDDIVITVDDDILYRSDLIENLMMWHERFPRAIITNWAKKIQLDKDGRSLYRHWPEVGSEDIGVEGFNYSIFGVGGVLYPPRCMYKDYLNCRLMRELCLTADDIWLSCMAILKKTAFVYTGYRQNHLPVSFHNNPTLLSINQSANQVCVDKMNDYYYRQGKGRPFVDLYAMQKGNL